MRIRRWPLLLLGSALVLLASLYLPWRTMSCGSACADLGLSSLKADGWSSSIGDAAALFCLVLAAVAVADLIRPALAPRLPLGTCALLMGYFGLAEAAQVRSLVHPSSSSVHFAYGAYIGIVAAVVALVAGVAILRDDLRRRRPAVELATIPLGVALLVSFLLPWARFGPVVGLLGISVPAAVVAAALLLCLLEASGATRFVVGLSVGLFTVGAFTSLNFPTTHAYGAWIGLGVGLAIAALAVPSRAALPSLRSPGWHALATGAAAALFAVALFLPWQSVCYDQSADWGPYAGRCVSTNGWASIPGAAAALLAIALVIAAFGWRRAVSAPTLAAGIAILVATMGFQIEHRNETGSHLGFGYGSWIGFVAAGALVALGLVGARLPKLDVRLAPVAGCISYLAVVVLPWWRVLPSGAGPALRFAPLSWLTVTGVLLAVWLGQLWLNRGSLGAEWLVIVPLAMLALASVDLIRVRAGGLSWAEAVIVIICLALAGLGRLEQQAGPRKLRVPKSLRLDRL